MVATYRSDNSASNIFSFLFILSIVALIGFVFFSIGANVVTPEQGFTADNILYFESHAYDKHGQEAIMGEQCKGTGYLFYNPKTNRHANVCLTNGVWGVYVWYEHIDNEITAFIKNKMSSFEQVARYMENAGYILR